MRLKHILLICLIGKTFILFAQETPTVNQAKNQLHQLETRIHTLKETLTHAHDKRGLLNQELSSTEKQIGEGIRHLQVIQQTMLTTQLKINLLQERVRELNKQLINQQVLLADHIRIRYKMGEYLPLKWIINQDDPYSISRLLTFHQYIVHSRQQIIDKIDVTKTNLTLNHSELKNELTKQQTLQHHLNTNQEKLERSKDYHTAVIQSLNNDIQTKEHILSEFERNKENLSHLLKTLASESVISTKLPFNRMRHKLPLPIKIGKQNMQKMNQGITFYANEGMTVQAVYSGKVVFSDWLNGYGLLLIIDHGQGYMTLYAHNQSLFKHKGTLVAQGEAIASVGHSGGIKQNGLYFEIREHGKAISPRDWLM